MNRILAVDIEFSEGTIGRTNSNKCWFNYAEVNASGTAQRNDLGLYETLFEIITVYQDDGCQL